MNDACKTSLCACACVYVSFSILYYFFTIELTEESIIFYMYKYWKFSSLSLETVFVSKTESDESTQSYLPGDARNFITRTLFFLTLLFRAWNIHWERRSGNISLVTANMEVWQSHVSLSVEPRSKHFFSDTHWSSRLFVSVFTLTSAVFLESLILP